MDSSSGGARTDGGPASSTTAMLEALLRERHTGSHWSFLLQVPDGTGTNKCRTADALAMGLWPSKGLDLHGFEIKATRSDWLREIDDPTKSEAFAKYCDYFWLVCAPNVADLTELPASWGMLTPTKNGSKLRAVKAADRNRSPEPIDRTFLAALFRATERDSVSEQQASALWHRGWNARTDVDRRNRKRHEKTDRILRDGELSRLQRQVEAFEESSGVTIDGWNAGNIGEAVRMVLDGKVSHLPRHLRDIRRQVDIAGKALDEALSNADAMLAEREGA